MQMDYQQTSTSTNILKITVKQAIQAASALADNALQQELTSPFFHIDGYFMICMIGIYPNFKQTSLILHMQRGN
jgi:hypothetical protein